MTDYENIFQNARRDLRIYHGHLLACMADADSNRARKLQKYASRADAIETAIRTLDAIEGGSTTTVNTSLEEEYLALSDARFDTVEAMAEAEDENELEGPGVY